MDFDGIDMDFLTEEEILGLYKDTAEFGGIRQDISYLDKLSDEEVLDLYNDVIESDENDFLADIISGTLYCITDLNTGKYKCLTDAQGLKCYRGTYKTCYITNYRNEQYCACYDSRYRDTYYCYNYDDLQSAIQRCK